MTNPELSWNISLSNPNKVNASTFFMKLIETQRMKQCAKGHIPVRYDV